ncbi:hypothetical protein [Streptomyces sp. YIM 98790]|uniref:hypothetical protein n=1 Tax=Streptomyces sp. YIM 98790 TaxID=2689077 RepID=UPI00140DE605|nr:hypothetical protein [Streptomyces sp. YIM 98790]
MHGGRRAAAGTAVLTALLLTAGCTSGTGDTGSGTGSGTGETPSAAGSATPAEQAGLTGDDIADICAAVPAQALELMGFPGNREPDRRCTWWENAEELPAVERALGVQVLLHGAEENATAAEAAEAAFREGDQWYSRMEVGRVEDDAWPTATDIPGLGDEARARIGEWPTGLMGSVREGELVVRHRNAILSVTATADVADARGRAREAEAPSLENVEAALVSAAVGVLTALGADPAGPAAPGRDAGEHPRAHPVCDTLADQAGTLLPGNEATDLTPGPSYAAAPGLAGCSWRVQPGSGHGHGHGHLEVRVAALAPSPLLGLSGTGMAAEQHRVWSGVENTTALDGLGDAASARRYTNEDATYRSSTVWVRQDNLLVFVEHALSPVLPAEELERRTVEVARDVLAAYA